MIDSLPSVRTRLANAIINHIELRRQQEAERTDCAMGRTEFCQRLSLGLHTLNVEREEGHFIRLSRLKDLLPLLDASIILHWQECTPQGLTVHSLPLDLEELERGCLPTVIRAMMQQQITEDHNVTKKRSTNERMGGLFDLSGRTFRRIWRPSVPSPIAWQSFVHIITALGIGYSIRFGGQPDEIVICKHATPNGKP